MKLPRLLEELDKLNVLLKEVYTHLLASSSSKGVYSSFQKQNHKLKWVVQGILHWKISTIQALQSQSILIPTATITMATMMKKNSLMISSFICSRSISLSNQSWHVSFLVSFGSKLHLVEGVTTGKLKDKEVVNDYTKLTRSSPSRPGYIAFSSGGNDDGSGDSSNNSGGEGVSDDGGNQSPIIGSLANALIIIGQIIIVTVVIVVLFRKGWMKVLIGFFMIVVLMLLGFMSYLLLL